MDLDLYNYFIENYFKIIHNHHINCNCNLGAEKIELNWLLNKNQLNYIKKVGLDKSWFLLSWEYGDDCLPFYYKEFFNLLLKSIYLNNNNNLNSNLLQSFFFSFNFEFWKIFLEKKGFLYNNYYIFSYIIRYYLNFNFLLFNLNDFITLKIEEENKEYFTWFLYDSYFDFKKEDFNLININNIININMLNYKNLHNSIYNLNDFITYINKEKRDLYIEEQVNIKINNNINLKNINSFIEQKENFNIKSQNNQSQSQQKKVISNIENNKLEKINKININNITVTYENRNFYDFIKKINIMVYNNINIFIEDNNLNIYKNNEKKKNIIIQEDLKNTIKKFLKNRNFFLLNNNSIFNIFINYLYDFSFYDYYFIKNNFLNKKEETNLELIKLEWWKSSLVRKEKYYKILPENKEKEIIENILKEKYITYLFREFILDMSKIYFNNNLIFKDFLFEENEYKFLEKNYLSFLMKKKEINQLTFIKEENIKKNNFKNRAIYFTEKLGKYCKDNEESLESDSSNNTNISININNNNILESNETNYDKWFWQTTFKWLVFFKPNNNIEFEIKEEERYIFSKKINNNFFNDKIFFNFEYNYNDYLFLLFKTKFWLNEINLMLENIENNYLKSIKRKNYYLEGMVKKNFLFTLELQSYFLDKILIKENNNYSISDWKNLLILLKIKNTNINLSFLFNLEINSHFLNKILIKENNNYSIDDWKNLLKLLNNIEQFNTKLNKKILLLSKKENLSLLSNILYNNLINLNFDKISDIEKIYSKVIINNNNIYSISFLFDESNINNINNNLYLHNWNLLNEVIRKKLDYYFNSEYFFNLYKIDNLKYMYNNININLLNKYYNYYNFEK